MLALFLLALASTANADGYATSSSVQAGVAPAPAPYGAPYSSNSLVVPSIPSSSIQVQPYTSFIQQPVPIGMQHMGVGSYPYGYGMMGGMQTGHPYQMYTQQMLPNTQNMLPGSHQMLPSSFNSLYMSYPQGDMNSFNTLRQSQPSGLPSSATSFIAMPTATPTASAGGYGGYATPTATTSAEAALSPPRPHTASSSDPWAALGGVTTKKAENRKKKDSEASI